MSPSASHPRCPLDFHHPEAEGKKYALFADDELRWVNITPGLCELLEYSPAELIGITAEQLLPPGVSRNEQLERDLIATGHLSRLVLLQAKSGNVVGLLADSHRLSDG